MCIILLLKEKWQERMGISKRKMHQLQRVKLSSWSRKSQGFVYNVYLSPAVCFWHLPLKQNQFEQRWQDQLHAFGLRSTFYLFLYHRKPRGGLVWMVTEQQAVLAIVHPRAFCRLYTKFQQATCWLYSSNLNAAHSFEGEDKTSPVDRIFFLCVRLWFSRKLYVSGKVRNLVPDKYIWSVILFQNTQMD